MSPSCFPPPPTLKGRGCLTSQLEEGDKSEKNLQGGGGGGVEEKGKGRHISLFLEVRTETFMIQNKRLQKLITVKTK